MVIPFSVFSLGAMGTLSAGFSVMAGFITVISGIFEESAMQNTGSMTITVTAIRKDIKRELCNINLLFIKTSLEISKTDYDIDDKLFLDKKRLHV
jgi:hypothetical protein